MKKLIALVLCIVFPMSVLAGDNGYKIGYDGGSIQDLKSGTGVKLYIEGTDIRVAKDGKDLALI